MSNLSSLKHPDYNNQSQDWPLFRLTYRGGREFIDRYLSRFSDREDAVDFSRRKAMTYLPAFAKLEINNVKNAIYQRSSDIIRKDGSQSYQNAIYGKMNGVDLMGSSMSYFIGQQIVPELLTMSRVGIYVDMPSLQAATKSDQGRKHPYLYYYPIEDILNWVYDESDYPNQFSALLLRDYIYEHDDETGFPIKQVEQFRKIWINDDHHVNVQFYNRDSEPITSVIELDIDRIPFIMPSLHYSLLEDVAAYQVALLNLASSEISYCLLANYPFYTEQYDLRQSSPYLQGHDEESIKVGVTQGRRYPVNTDRPDFIHPSPEPLIASMSKEEELKKDIKSLVHSAIANLPEDGGTVEAGLSYIGLILQDTENKIAEYWGMYEQQPSATVIYPSTYQLSAPKDVREDVDLALRLINTINSQTYRKEIAKHIVHKTLGTKSSIATLLTINNEIDQAEVIVCDPDTIRLDVEAGLVSTEMASLTRGYPEGQVDQAKIDHAERLARIQAAQSPVAGDASARGLKDFDPSLGDQVAKNEKLISQSADLDGDMKKGVRGQS